MAATSGTDDGDEHKSTVETHPRTESPVPLEVCCYWSQHRHSHVLMEAVRVSSACCFVRSCASKRNAMTSCWKLASRWAASHANTPNFAVTNASPMEQIVQTATEELDRETRSTVVASFKNAVAKLRSSWRALTVSEGSVDAEAKFVIGRHVHGVSFGRHANNVLYCAGKSIAIGR